VSVAVANESRRLTTLKEVKAAIKRAENVAVYCRATESDHTLFSVSKREALSQVERFVREYEVDGQLCVYVSSTGGTVTIGW
jgi:hypothetical protein